MSVNSNLSGRWAGKPGLLPGWDWPHLGEKQTRGLVGNVTDRDMKCDRLVVLSKLSIHPMDGQHACTGVGVVREGLINSHIPGLLRACRHTEETPEGRTESKCTRSCPVFGSTSKPCADPSAGSRSLTGSRCLHTTSHQSWLTEKWFLEARIKSRNFFLRETKQSLW